MTMSQPPVGVDGRTPGPAALGFPWMPGMNRELLDLPLAQTGTSFARLRLPRPLAYEAMEESIRRYGQLSAVVVGRCEGAHEYEIVDGFKRRRALDRLGAATLKARVLDGGVRAWKAGIVHLNRKVSAICEMEEALVMFSLHRDDGLEQLEIAVLLGRDASWVCRRIALAARLTEEVQKHIHLGLIPVSMGRELSKLPRGNQETALQAVRCVSRPTLE